MVAFHVVVEGEALRIQEGLVRLFRCPLLRQINRRIARDEARHVAFGRLYLGGRVAALPSRERREIHHWVKRLWSESAIATLRNLEGRGSVARVFLQGWLRCGWARHARTLAAVGLVDPQGMSEGAR
jgi:gluconate kinase